MSKRGIVCKGNGLVKQAMAKECDINNIMKKYRTTGVLPTMIKKNPMYGDFSSVGDYRNCLETVSKANDQFMALAPEVRKRFRNDPAEFLAFTNDEKNVDEMGKLGLLKPKDVVSEVKTEVKPEAK